MPAIDIASPPIVPAATGIQKASLLVSTINGIKPSMVETTVRKMGMIFEFHALMYSFSEERPGRLRRIWL